MAYFVRGHEIACRLSSCEKWRALEQWLKRQLDDRGSRCSAAEFQGFSGKRLGSETQAGGRFWGGGGLSAELYTISRLGIEEWSVVESCEVCASRF
ncbi:hypothetical protein [Rubritalea tangerina]|uniref:hypothetical protein n=1 Tax=Rubritalea tangerina TaxID=430798 RepID=UPI00361455DF